MNEDPQEGLQELLSSHSLWEDHTQGEASLTAKQAPWLLPLHTDYPSSGHNGWSLTVGTHEDPPFGKRIKTQIENTDMKYFI